MGICLIVKSGGGVDTSNATVTADKILSGYTVYVNDSKITGTMVNVGNQNITDTTWGQAGRTKYWGWPGGTIYIWGGWHDGTSGVDAWSLASQTGGCDIPGTDSCLKGYSYWNTGIKYDGTMPAIGTQNWTIGANGSQTIGWGWHSGSGTVKQSIGVDTGEWGPTPTTSQTQLCWSGWYYSKNRWCWGNGNLVAGNIKSGVSIFGVTGSWQGWVDKTIGWNALGLSVVYNIGEYTVKWGSYTPATTPFSLTLDLATYTKLINAGMTYVCWDATVNLYKDIKRDTLPIPRASFYGWFGIPTSTGSGRITIGAFNYINQDKIDRYTSDRITVVVLWNGTTNIGEYGADCVTSGKYNIKNIYDTYMKSGITWSRVEMSAYNYDDSDINGKVWIKSFNLWFSKT